MKKIIIILLFILTAGLFGCKYDSISTKPSVFIVAKITRDRDNKKTGTNMYLIHEWRFLSDGSKSLLRSDWHTLEEGFEIGDTLTFVTVK